MNEDKTGWLEQKREADRIDMLRREAEIRRRTLAALGQCTLCGAAGHPLSRCPMAGGLIRQREIL